jgi:hypothetical protein
MMDASSREVVRILESRTRWMDGMAGNLYFHMYFSTTREERERRHQAFSFLLKLSPYPSPSIIMHFSSLPILHQNLILHTFQSSHTHKSSKQNNNDSSKIAFKFHHLYLRVCPGSSQPVVIKSFISSVIRIQKIQNP